MAKQTYEYINFALSLTITSFLVPVIIFKSSKEMGNYKYLLLIFVLSDIHYSFLHLFLDVKAGPYRDAFLFFDASGSFIASKASIYWFAAAHTQALVLLSYHFVYRYVVTVGEMRPQFSYTFSKLTGVSIMVGSWVAEIVIWNVMLIISMQSGNGVFDRTLTTHFLYGREEMFLEYIHDMMEESFPGRMDIVVGTLYWYQDGSINLRGFLAWNIFNVVLSFCLVAIAYCSYHIIKALFQSNVTLSARNFQLQKQLFATLVLQLLIPLTLIYIPCLFNVTAGLARIYYMIPQSYQTFMMTIFPALDALVILFGITSYRKFVISLLMRKKVVPLATMKQDITDLTTVV